MTETREMNQRALDQLNRILQARGINGTAADEIRGLFNEQRKSSEEDPLTGLQNRGAFARELEERLDVVNQNPFSMGIGVVYLDGDRFKRYNDTYSHGQGDILLRTVGQHLLETHRKTDIFAGRQGGDEFVAAHHFMFETPQAANELETTHFPRIVRRICEGIAGLTIQKADHGTGAEENTTLYRPSKGMGYSQVTATVGGFLYLPSRGIIRSTDELLTKADEALSSAKETRRGSYKVITSERKPRANRQPATR